METSIANEKQLLADIELLREQFQQTQELYREVCALLFFRYGITPTANKLYQLVRKGSMSAPAEALGKFWEDMREKSRVRIEHPDLPDALKTAAGELTATLWVSAQTLANDSLATYRSEAQAQVTEAKATAETAETESRITREALEKAEGELNAAHNRISVLNQDLAAAMATNASLELQLHQSRTDNLAQQQLLVDARRDFTAELEKLRAAAQLADERVRASEIRALLEIDRERSTSSKLQKDLDTTRTTAAQLNERMQSEITNLQAQLGDIRQNTGIVEGKLQSALAGRDVIANDLKIAQVQLADIGTQLSDARNDSENWRRNAEDLQRAITELKNETPKLTRAFRRVKAE
ncbi:DNA-binding protein [Solimicrobium silvestre]|uniref:Plasmid replication region DNA-binding N-term n=1 Tax=Solimicrobium silvestre TaxID=2099400 RepID=A0A2S9GZY9_9BURK|nr:DNA-binding protein [Solimicrobium silvestre]PRC93186.1 Plasmid replication region DNA-binding N-term [Solimicrobium silvestre]